MFASLTLAATLLVAPQDPATLLAKAVDHLDADARKAAALALAARDDVSLQQWREVMRAFGSFAPCDPGPGEETVELWTRDGIEKTGLFVYVPKKYDPRTPTPLLLAAHGTGASGRGIARLWRDVAEQAGLLVVAPSEAGPNDGYRFSNRERDAALSAIRWARRRFNVDENRVFVTGISRGGHLAWDLGLRFPDRFAGIAPMIGGPRLNIGDGQNNLRYLENVVRLAIEDLQGAKDDPALVFNVQLAFERLEKLRAPEARLHLHADLGHDFRLETVDWPGWFAAARRTPAPLRVVRMATRNDQARAFWVEALTFDGKKIAEEFRPRVSQQHWQRLDDAGKRRYMQQQAERRTARLEVERTAPGRFRAKTTGVTSFRLLLTDDMVDARKPVQVSFRARIKTARPEPDKRVLLLEFVERFDRTFLPTREIVVP